MQIKSDLKVISSTMAKTVNRERLTTPKDEELSSQKEQNTLLKVPHFEPRKYGILGTQTL